MGHKTSLDVFKMRKTLSSVGETNSVIQPVTQLLYRVGCAGCKIYTRSFL